MKTNLLPSLGRTLAVSAWLAVMPPAAQSQNTQAAVWFQTGLKATAPQAKIEAYARALRYDSTMIEAHYNLALVYKQQLDFARAEKYLRQANALKTTRANMELKSRILYDLAGVYRRQGKARASEEILRQAKQQIKDAKMLGSVYFELGKLLIEQKRYDDAIVELSSGQQLDSGNKTFFLNLIQIAQNSAAADRQYEQALQAETRGAYEEAQKLLQEINTRLPDYRDVAGRLVRLDSALSQASQQQRLLAVAYEQAVQYETLGKLELAAPVYENLLQQNGGDYKDAQARLATVRQQLEQRQRDEKIATEYTAGLTALAGQNWTRAILAFEQVLELNPDYLEAKAKLAEAQTQLKRENSETVAARYYADGVAAVERQDLGAALAAFEKVSEISPNYREVAKRLKQIENQLQQTAASSPASPAVTSQVETLYSEAQAAMVQQDWMQAVIRLETVQVLQPNYRDVIELLVQSRVKLGLASQQNAASEEPGNGMAVAGIVIAAIVLPLLGIAAFSSTFRARYYLLRGNHGAAARIFERLLAKHPERAKLNSTLVNTLSNYYLLSGRTDNRALEIYETAQQSRSAGVSPRKEEMDNILKQHGHADEEQHEDALLRLENRLKNHQFQSPSSNR